MPEESIWTSALATATFLADQLPYGSAYVIGEAGMTTALHEVGYTLTDRKPDFVVLGETRTYSFETITKAIRLIERGARFIATNPDASGPSADGPLPATGSVAALITKATGRDPYFVGKPNPMMFRSALNRIEAHSETTVMVGDRMDTDIVAGIEAGLDTILVLTGSTKRTDIDQYPYRPRASPRIDCGGHRAHLVLRQRGHSWLPAPGRMDRGEGAEWQRHWDDPVPRESALAIRGPHEIAPAIRGVV